MPLPRRPDIEPDLPTIAQQDWDELKGTEPAPESFENDEFQSLEDDEFPLEGEVPGDLPKEDDDNPFQESDEALPDDEEERAISRNLAKDDEV